MGSPGKNNSKKKQISKVQQSQKANTETNSKKPKQPIQESNMVKLDRWMERRLNLVFTFPCF